MINKRQEDLSKVFDRNWKANHNDDVKRAREKEKKIMDKMFNTKSNQGVVKPLTPGQSAEILHNNMNNAFNGKMQSNLNNIVKKWR